MPQTGQQLGAKPKPFTGTGAWLIKQVPLGQKAAGAGFYSVCQSVPGWLEGTLQHTKGRGDATVCVCFLPFFSIPPFATQEFTKEKRERMLLFAVFRFTDFGV